MIIHQAFARAIYVSGAPLGLLEHPLWKEALHLLNPTYSTPSRKLLSTSLLEKEYADVQKIVTETTKLANVLHLAIDGWTNIRNESILNVMLYAPKPYFYKFITTDDFSHTADYLFTKVSEILDEVGNEKFLAIVSDNAANMVKCGDLIQRKYKHMAWVGCLAHTLHLWIGDILKTSKVRCLFSLIVEIIKTVKQSHILNARFNIIGKERNTNTALQLPVKTRWGSYLFCLESFQKSKYILQNMAINEDNHQLQRFKIKLLDESMWDDFKELEYVLKPTVRWISKLEGDYCSIHLVYKAFNELEEILSNPLTAELLEEDMEPTKIKFFNRKKNALKPLHLAANILDPKNQGSDLSTSEHLEGCEFIINLDCNSSSNAEIILQEFTNYKNHADVWQKDFVWQMAKTVAPILWWQSLYSKTMLGNIAMKILSVPATSASVERSFSTFSHIHTNKRNRLKTDRAAKICYIAHNWKLINRPTSISTSEPDTEIDSSLQILQDEVLSGSEDEFSDIAPELDAILVEPSVERPLEDIDIMSDIDPLSTL